MKPRDEDILETADRYARHDPDIDWPSDRHTDPVDAIMHTLDATRERIARSAGTDHATTAAGYLERADEWANRDGVRDPEHRAHMIDYNLRLAEIHATLAIAQEVSRVPSS